MRLSVDGVLDLLDNVVAEAPFVNPPPPNHRPDHDDMLISSVFQILALILLQFAYLIWYNDLYFYQIATENPSAARL